jgi:hypothetical protein
MARHHPLEIIDLVQINVIGLVLQTPS